MSDAPIELAYVELGDRIAEALVDVGFLTGVAQLQRDPPGPAEPTGDETEVQRSAQLFRLETKPARDFFGANRKHYAVERQVRLELAAFGPPPTGQTNHEALLADVFDAVAVLVEDDDGATLGGLCERCILTGGDDDDLPPNGLKKALTWTIRLRAGDPLGRTAVA